MAEAGEPLSKDIGVDPARLVFVGGLHRSGTTALGRVLAAHSEVSGFSKTGSIEDEGQHLQDVYRSANDFGGPGRFARDDHSHLGPVPATESEVLRRRLMQAWAPHWNLDRHFLVEKSPPNLVMGQYLQSIFPGSALIVIVRHPVIVALSTKKWRRGTSLHRLVEHWFIAHRRLRQDAAQLERFHVLRYEDLIADPEVELETIGQILGLKQPLAHDLIQQTRSDVYVDTWAAMATGNPVDRARRRRIESEFGEAAREYGYDVGDVTARGPQWPPSELRR